MKTRPQISKRSAIRFVLLLGLVSLFADMTYEGARSITGQYLAVLGASGAIVGIVAGFGELIGYGFRLVFGYISDRTQCYWLITFLGYILNLVAVPLLAFAGNWPVACVLIIMERLGKAIRSPAKDALLSYATQQTGRGWGFGLHEAMDQIGAILGPLIVSVVLYYQGSYQMSFGCLLIPALCALSILILARTHYPHPQDLEVENPSLKTKGFSRPFWLYVVGISCVAAGYVDFPLFAYHFKKIALIDDALIPIFFACAMASAGISALILGRLFDKKGLNVLILSTALVSLFAPLVFIDGFYFALFGVVLWGIGLGAQESIMRATVATFVNKDKRATAFGIVHIWFGLAWFLGSAIMGFLYDISLVSLVIFSLGMQLLAIPFLFLSKNEMGK